MDDHAMIREIIQRATENVSQSGFPVDITVDNVEVYADPLLEKVFYNLADNAIRYGEHVTILKIYLTITDHTLSIICEDDGVGIPDKEKRQIFDRGVGKNTGLGLFLTREILLITGILIEENGVPGKGARFEIKVPNGTWRFIQE